jgi:Phosphotyrosyl phosphate activator (PTPA) protein
LWLWRCRLEPAGSHGVWGLDDYHILPFVWGSAQLLNHPYIRPKNSTSSEILEGYSDEYMYLSCIKFVTQVGGPFLDGVFLWRTGSTWSCGTLDCKCIRISPIHMVPLISTFLGDFSRFLRAMELLDCKGEESLVCKVPLYVCHLCQDFMGFHGGCR